MLIDTINDHPEAASSTIMVQGRHDWINEALNSPAGRLADHLFNERTWEDEAEAPVEPLLVRAEQLLSLPRGPRLHAIAQLAMRTNWFFHNDRDSTEKHLVPLIETGAGSDIGDAAMAGFLWQARFPPNELFLRLKHTLLALFEEGSSSRRHHNLLSIILAGWFRKESSDGRLLASDDLREALVTTSEENRVGLLRLLASWADENAECAAQTVEFLHSVWPRQLAAKSPAASAALAELALRSGDRMAETTTAVLSIIGTTTEHIDPLPFLRRTEDDQISRFPEEHLALFYAVLPENAAFWPWGVGQVIEQLIEVPALKGDRRLAELRRRLARI